jgi:hypothetical protein
MELNCLNSLIATVSFKINISPLFFFFLFFFVFVGDGGGAWGV